MISIQGAVAAVLFILIGGAIYGLLLLLINKFPVPEEFKVWARLVLLVIAVLIAIGFLLSLISGGVGSGVGPIFRP